MAPADYLPFYEANKGGSGGLNWASCVGWNGQWLTMAYVNLNWSYTLPYAANGGESDCFACPLGFSRHSQLQFDKGTGWQNWMCYDTTFIWNGPDGSNITGCSNNSFDTNYK